MSTSENQFTYGDFSPESFMPASTELIYDLGRKTDTFLDSHYSLETVTARLTGDYKDLAFTIKSEISFDDENNVEHSYGAVFHTNDDRGLSLGGPIFKIGFDQEENEYAEFNNLSIKTKDTIDKLAFFTSNLLQLIVSPEHEDKISQDKTFMESADAGYDFVHSVLDGHLLSRLDEVYEYCEENSSAYLKRFDNESLAKALMSWLQNNRSTIVRNSKTTCITLDEGLEFAVDSSRAVKNKRRSDGLNSARFYALDCGEEKSKKNDVVNLRSRSINFVNKNSSTDLSEAFVATHNGDTNFLDEIHESLVKRNSGKDSTDNKIIKTPTVADVNFFAQKLDEARSIIAKS